MIDIERVNMKGVHQIMCKAIFVTHTAWKARGKGRGYGYVTNRVKKCICSIERESVNPVAPDISTREVEPYTLPVLKVKTIVCE